MTIKLILLGVSLILTLTLGGFYIRVGTALNGLWLATLVSAIFSIALTLYISKDFDNDRN